MSELDDALYRAARYNNGAYHPETNPYGHTGKGGTLANWVRSLRDGVSIYNGMAALWNSINFVAERAAVASILQRCQDLVGQVTKGSTEALSFPIVDKLLLTSGAVAQVCVYDTRLDDRLPDGSRWNEPGRCSGMSWWHEAQGVYRGPKRDFPVVALIVALREQWWIYDALDLDPVTGAPRLWAGSNPQGNGLVSCGSTAPINSVFARNGYVYFGTGMGLHVVSLTGDWCQRYDNSGRRRRLGTFAQRNSVLTEGGVTASGAIIATQVNGIHARVLPGAPLDAAGMPIPTVAVATAGGASVIHPSGQVVHLTGAGFLCCHIGEDYRLHLAQADSDLSTDHGPVPYHNSNFVAWRDGWSNPNNGLRSLPGGWFPTAIASDARGDNAGLTHVAWDLGGGNHMVAYATPIYATGWQPGDTRLATLCDATTGAIGSGELVNNPGGPFTTTAGWPEIYGGSLSVSGGELVYVAPAGGVVPGPTLTVATVPGLTYVVAWSGRRKSTGAGYQVDVVGIGGSVVQSSTTVNASDFIQFTATAATHQIKVGISSGSTTTNDGFYLASFSVKAAAADRSYKGKGLAVHGTLQRHPVATGADAVAWSGFSATNYLQRPYDADMDIFGGDFVVAVWMSFTGNGFKWPFACASFGLALSESQSIFYMFGADGNAPTVGPALNDGRWHQLFLVRRQNVAEIWVDGVRVATSFVGGIGATPASGLINIGGNVAAGQEFTTGSLAMLRAAAYAPTPAQIRRMYEDERPLFGEGAKCLLGGTSSAVASLDRDPLTGRLAVGTGDGVSVFQGLRRVSYYDADVLAGTTSDTVRSVALRGGSLLIGTAAEVGFVADAVPGKEAIAAGGVRAPLRPWLVTGRTTDATPTALGPRIAVGERETGTAIITMKGRTYGASAAEDLTYHKRVDWYRNAGGNVTIRGVIIPVSDDDETTASPCDCTFIADATSQTIAVQVTGKAGSLIAWEGTLTVHRRSEETIYAAQ